MQFKNDGLEYNVTTTDEHDRKWEEDIVGFADTSLDFLQGHPKLHECTCNMLYYNSLRHGDGGYESLYNLELREDSIRRIKLLIASIGEKSDSELMLGCSEIIALLNDAHSTLIRQGRCCTFCQTACQQNGGRSYGGKGRKTRDNHQRWPYGNEIS